MKVTAERLREGNACEDQVKIFEEEWPKGAQTTLKNLKRAAELELDLDWFAGTLLNKKQQKEFFKKTDQDWKEWNKRAITDEEYDKKAARVLFDTLKRK